MLVFFETCMKMQLKEVNHKIFNINSRPVALRAVGLFFPIGEINVKK